MKAVAYYRNPASELARKNRSAAEQRSVKQRTALRPRPPEKTESTSQPATLGAQRKGIVRGHECIVSNNPDTEVERSDTSSLVPETWTSDFRFYACVPTSTPHRLHFRLASEQAVSTGVWSGPAPESTRLLISSSYGGLGISVRGRARRDRAGTSEFQTRPSLWFGFLVSCSLCVYTIYYILLYVIRDTDVGRNTSYHLVRASCNRYSSSTAVH